MRISVEFDLRNEDYSYEDINNTSGIWDSCDVDYENVSAELTMDGKLQFVYDSEECDK